MAERLVHETGYEDLLVGQVLREAGIPLSIEPRLVPLGNHEMRPQLHNNLLTVHGVEPSVFLAAHADVRLEASAMARPGLEN